MKYEYPAVVCEAMNEETQAALLLDFSLLPDASSDCNRSDLWASVGKLLLGELQQYDVVQFYVMTSPGADDGDDQDFGLHFFKWERVVVTIFSASDSVQAFYEAKQALDAKEITDIRLLCHHSRRAYWTAVCRLLYTPVHKWTVGSDNCSSPAQDGDQITHPHDDVVLQGEDDPAAVRASVERYLRSLPSVLGSPEVHRSELIPGDVFVHGYSTRRGGISVIPSLASMNVFYTDKKRDSQMVIDENRRRLAEVGGFDPNIYHIVKVEHGHRVWVVGKDQPNKFDALVTNQMDVTIAAAGADCIPLLFADPVAMVIGAAHAGWRGTVERVGACVVRTMVDEFGSRPENIRVAMGPSLQMGCFSLPPEEAKLFSDIHPSCVATNLVRVYHRIDDVTDTHSKGKQSCRQADLKETSNPVNGISVKHETRNVDSTLTEIESALMQGNSVHVSRSTSMESERLPVKRGLNPSAGQVGSTLIEIQEKQNLVDDSGTARITVTSKHRNGVHVNLQLANRYVLEREGIKPEHIDESTAVCTRCNPQLYYSFERDGFPFGNQIGFICMPS